jgi:type I restriction enzyme S subunit
LGTVARGRSRHRPRNDPALFGGPYPFFQTGDVKAAELYLTAHQETYNQKGLAQSRLWPAGTLCITIAANIADAAILGVPGCFPDSVVGFTPYPEKSEVIFVKYLLDYVKRRFENISRGTTQDNLSLDKLLSVSIRYPEIDAQRKIAAILSAYDDLIENNNRRVRILEEMAQRIYREWFVDFRYPGHENITLSNSALGPIPRGWTVGTLDDVLSLLGAGSRPRGGIDPSERGVPSVGAENIIGIGQYDYRKEKFVSRSFFERMRKGRIDNGDVVLYKDGAYIGRVSLFRDGFPHAECAVNEHVFVLRTNEKYSQILLYLWLAHPDNRERVRALNANAAQPGLNQEKLRALTLVVPPPELVRRFTDTVEPIIGLLFHLAMAVPRASNARDLLLPRLISGEINVDELDAAVPELAA